MNIKFIILIFFISSLAFSQIKFKAVGDIMPGSLTPYPLVPADSGKRIERGLGDLLKNADISIGNFEGVLTNGSFTPCKCSEKSRKSRECFEFGVPVYMGNLLKNIGLNVLSFDNNHCRDYGNEAYSFSLNNLLNLGLSVVKQKGYVVRNVKGKSIAIVAFGFDENSNDINDIENAKILVSDLKLKFNRVVVYFHGGAEGAKAAYLKDEAEVYLGENRGSLVKFAHAVVDAGADVVLGSGPHVLRTLELYKDKIIAYSLGNFLTYGNFNLSGICGVSCIFEFEINEENGNFVSGKIVPIKQKNPGIPVYDEKNASILLLKNLMEDYKQSNLLIDLQGNIKRK